MSNFRNISLNYLNSNYTIINSRKWYKSTPKQITTLTPNILNKSQNIINNNNIMSIPLGDKYIGEQYNGIPYGRGKYFSSNGEIREGYFINGKLNGKGKMHLNNGIYLEGNFINDKLNGEGKSININGEKYEGNYTDGIRNGKGKLIIKGKSYDCEFKYGKLITDIKSFISARKSSKG